MPRVWNEYCLPFVGLRGAGSMVLADQVYMVFALYERKNQKRLETICKGRFGELTPSKNPFWPVSATGMAETDQK